MQKKQVNVIPTGGMIQDKAVNQFDANYAYELRNIRIVTTGDNTTSCLTNEKSNVRKLDLEGLVLGCQEIDNKVILFARSDTAVDYILLIEEENDTLKSNVLYKGDLNFDFQHPIESIGIYETSEVQKVYWVDGKNTPRVLLLNLEKVDGNYTKYIKENDDTQFDFHPKLSTADTKLKVTPVFNSSGLFHGGVIQYALAYYNRFGQSTGVLYYSPLFYTSDNGRGLNPDGSQKSSVSFKVEAINMNTNFNHVRIYRIFRTSLDATPVVSLIKEAEIKNGSTSSTTN